MTLFWYWNYWNASDISPVDNCSKARIDLVDDCSWVIDQENDIVIGWVHDVDHNGIAHWDGSTAICSDTTIGKPDWPHDSIVQHEVSHFFSVKDQGTWWDEHPECIMNYWYAWWGTDIWCSSCRATVNENIWGD